MKDDVVVKVEHVSKDFILPHEKVTTAKRAFTSFFKRNRTKEAQHALRDINFEIKKGEFFGIVGRNGSGKSTLLKIIAGIYQPTKGNIEVKGRLVPFIELGVGFSPELTGRENVYLNGAMLGFSKKQVEENYKRIVEFAELEKFMDQKLKNYSSGMQVRLAFACATMAEPEILIVDEVLAVGDSEFQRKCFDYFKSLKKKNTTVIFVTHDMNAVKEFCDRAVMIEKSNLVHEGTPEDIAREYALLFIDNSQDFESKGKRWGTGDAQFEDVKVSLKGNDLIVKTKVKVHKDIEKMIYGLHIKAATGEEITAMNNRMVQVPDVKDLKKGNTVRFDWKMLNVFNDGKYTVTTTLNDQRGNNLDWYDEAAKFEVKRIERSTTFVIPPLSVENTVENK